MVVLAVERTLGSSRRARADLAVRADNLKGSYPGIFRAGTMLCDKDSDRAWLLIVISSGVDVEVKIYPLELEGRVEKNFQRPI